MLPENTILIILPLSIYLGFRYIKLVFRGKVTPNICTWVVWCITNFISFIAVISSGASFLETFTTFLGAMMLLITLVVTLISRKGIIKFSTLDIACFLISMLALIIWQTSSNPLYALIFSFLSSLIGGMPTAVKTFWRPKSEDPRIFAAGVFSSILQILTLKQFTIFTLLFPIYIAVFNTIIVVLTYRNSGSKQISETA